MPASKLEETSGGHVSLTWEKELQTCVQTLYEQLHTNAPPLTVTSK